MERKEIFLMFKKTVIGFLVIANAIYCGSGQTIPYQNQKWKKNGITSLEEIMINHTPHSVLIRGTDTKNPILVVIHGYAIPMMPFVHLDYASIDAKDPNQGEMEKHFVLVYYDQRAVGKTSRYKSDMKSLTIDQYVLDAEELVSQLRKRFHKDKVHILGISWGSIIGMKLIQKRPEWIASFTSEGQTVNLKETYHSAWEFALSEAQKNKDKKAIKELEKLELPASDRPVESNIKSIDTIVQWMDHYQKKNYGLMDLRKLFFSSLKNAPEYSTIDMLNTLKAIQPFTMATTQELLKSDLRNEIPEVKVPVHFIVGEHDLNRIAARDYFKKLKAPFKKMTEIKNAGHAPSADQPIEVLNLYLKNILQQSEK